jgi:4-hydroxy-tetrahydrodipicolinate reductase
MKKVIIIGNGKLAEAIKYSFNDFSNVPIQEYYPNIEADQDTIFVHIGSGRQYNESLTLAEKCESSYIQAATEKDIKLNIPSDQKIKYINAPNLDINIIKLFYWLKLADNLFENEPKTIIESHQKEKKSLPGTAIKFCDYLNIPHKDIVSIRDVEHQKAIQIENLNQHAFHRIQIGDSNSKITIETKIEGAQSYVKGLSRIVDCISRLDKGIYEVEDLVKLDLL